MAVRRKHPVGVWELYVQLHLSFKKFKKSLSAKMQLFIFKRFHKLKTGCRRQPLRTQEPAPAAVGTRAAVAEASCSRAAGTVADEP